MNIADTLRASASRLPDKVALTTADVEITYGDLDRDVDRVAAGLHECGVRVGDRVLVVGRNNPAFARNLYAVWRFGAVAVPTNPELTPTEFDHVLADSGACAVLTRSAPEALDGAVARHADLHHVVTETGEDGTAAVRDFPSPKAWPAEPPPAASSPVAGADSGLALLQYTSGTTGRPKGAMLTHDNMLANHRQLDRTRIGVAEHDAVLGVLPVFHVYGLNVGLAYPLARGARVHLVERFRALDTLRQIGNKRLSIVLGAPPVFMAWVAAAASTPDESFDLSCVRAAVSGASALPVETWLAFQERFDVEIWQGYGLTETSPVVTTTAMSDDAAPGSIGRPLPGLDVRLRDQSGEPVRVGDPGEILVRGPNVFAGYWRDDAGTAAVLDPEGWLHTGDVAYVEEGNLYLVDRKTDVVIVSGFNVYPKEVEQALTDHPDVGEAAVVGRTDERTGECVVAYVVPAAGIATDAVNVDAVSAHARERLARFKWPEVINVVEALPHLLTGKVSRRALRDWDPT